LEFSALGQLAQELSLAETVRTPIAVKLHAPFERLGRYLSQQPMNYQLFRCWSWKQSRFIDAPEVEDSAVRVEWWQRPQRLDRPDYFCLRVGKDVFCTYSRNWALLAAAKFAGAIPYERSDGALCSTAFPWVFLPPAVGRFCFSAGGGAAGPVRLESGDRYVYPLGSVRAATSVLATLGFTADSNLTKMPRWLEAVAVTHANTEALVPLSVGAAARRRVPVSLRPLFVAHGRRR
jgi:hypothetical protein